MRLEPVHDRLDDERHVCELLAGRLLEFRAMLGANPRDAREVDLEDRAHVRRRVLRHDHVLGDQRAHLRHRLDAVARPRLGKRPVSDGSRSGRRAGARRRRLRARFEEAEQVLFRDAARDARAAQRADLDAVLGGHASNERRRLGAQPILERAPVSVRWRGLRAGAAAMAQTRRPSLARTAARPRRAAGAGAAAAGAADGCIHVSLEARDDGLHGDRLAFGDENLGEHAGRRCRNLGVDLVRRDLEHRLVALHLIADLLQPFRQRAFRNRFAHLGHDDVYTCHRITLVPSCSRAGAHAEAARLLLRGAAPHRQLPQKPYT